MAQIRKDSLVNNQYYHIFSRSISGYIIFNDSSEFHRMLDLMKFFRFVNFNHRYSQFIDLELSTQIDILNKLKYENNVLVEIVAYCVMPTHIHLLLKQVADNGITKYLGRILNSYSRYFNAKHHRSGPLWDSRFKNVLVASDEQLLHISRYIHLNPTSADLVNDPENWVHSSYHEYINANNNVTSFCEFKKIINLNSKQYKTFTDNRKSYQHDLSFIKNILIDNYTG